MCDKQVNLTACTPPKWVDVCLDHYRAFPLNTTQIISYVRSVMEAVHDCFPRLSQLVTLITFIMK